MLKVIEILAESNKSWEDATQQAVASAGKKLRNIRSIYIKNFEAKVENNQIAEYRINGQITFELDEQKQGNQNGKQQSRNQQPSNAQQPGNEQPSTEPPEQQFTG